MFVFTGDENNIILERVAALERELEEHRKTKSKIEELIEFKSQVDTMKNSQAVKDFVAKVHGGSETQPGQALIHEKTLIMTFQVNSHWYFI
jgi:antirestriction protein